MGSRLIALMGFIMYATAFVSRNIHCETNEHLSPREFDVKEVCQSAGLHSDWNLFYAQVMRKTEVSINEVLEARFRRDSLFWPIISTLCYTSALLFMVVQIGLQRDFATFRKVRDERVFPEYQNKLTARLCHESTSFQSRKIRKAFSLISLIPVLSLALLSVDGVSAMIESTWDLRENIINGTEACFHYDDGEDLFQMNCSVLEWRSQGYGPKTHISLGVNETFEGSSRSSHNGKSTIDLKGVADFEGLFAIRADVTRFRDAPVIRSILVNNGTVAKNGGYIVRKEQTFFVVDSCSSTGIILGDNAGGICGSECGHSKGELRIFNSQSSGKIVGRQSGGIVGSGAANQTGLVGVKHCWSTGDIAGVSSGGIFGASPGANGGTVHVDQSFSNGHILSSAAYGGGTLGRHAGLTNGYIQIQNSYSTGNISARGGGGITGSKVGEDSGQVRIINCSSHGTIVGIAAGGICGNRAGYEHGDVSISDSYSKGDILQSAEWGGGITGANAGEKNGSLRIRGCYSTGIIYGKKSGGITGGHPGEDYGKVHITNCSSEGNIQGLHAGGICGNWAGSKHGEVYIEDSYSRGGLVKNADFGGGIVGLDAAVDQGYVNIQNCYSTGNISTKWSGGIAGGNAGERYGKVHITNCSSEGNIQGLYAGGICGNWAGYEHGKVYIEDSYSTGDIFEIASYAGGIVGRSAGQNNGSVRIQGCYSTGRISAEKSGGIAGSAAGGGGGEVRITNCSSEGTIEGLDAGGICGDLPGHKNGKAFIEGSYSTGDIRAEFAGGIVGLGAAFDRGYVYIRNCYSTGNVSAKWSGGIAGGNPGERYGIVHITNCSSVGNIQGLHAGGICGNWAGYEHGEVYIEDCYSTGDIFESASYAGGIVGRNAGHNNGSVRIQGCYSTGRISAEKSGGIAGSAAGRDGGEVRITNCSSEGTIEGLHAGGICGNLPGHKNGKTLIEGSYSTGEILAEFGGGIVGLDTAFNQGYIYIRNCYSTGNISAKRSGGIAGGSLGREKGEAHITNCSSVGDIVGPSAGGICGNVAGYKRGKVRIEDSYSTGDLLKSAAYAGGIAGLETGFVGGYVHVQRCFSTGAIEAKRAGGIIGGNGAENNGEVHVVDCHSQGNISGPRAGGISGNTAGSKGGKMYINRCSSTGSILENAISSGGIVGTSPAWENGYILVEGCSSTGSIMAEAAGGIAGSFAGLDGGTANITQCHSRGQIAGLNAGGIVGRYAGQNDGTANITQCHSKGQIAGVGAGGISGDSAGEYHGVVSISQSSSKGDIVDNARFGGGILGSLAGVRNGSVLVSECYSTGVIGAKYSGGICGGNPAKEGGEVHVVDSYSQGDISGENAGGIGGNIAGTKGGKVYITHAFSTGNIRADAHNSGGIVGDGAGWDRGYVEIRNCHSVGNISAKNSGGISGTGAATNNGDVQIINCSSQGHIEGKNAGGICGQDAGANKGKLYIYRSNSTGDIYAKAEYGGGITGIGTGSNMGYAHIRECHSIGKVSAYKSGGIIGGEPGVENGEVHMSHCSSEGSIEGFGAGGICGNYAGHKNGKVFINESFSTGDILPTARHAGGIVGLEAGSDNGYVRIQECYSTGKISGKYSGGITGGSAAENGGEVHVIKCHSQGNISAVQAGGICGHVPGARRGKMYISRSSSTGDILEGADKSGGIVGVASGWRNGSVSLDECFSTGAIMGENTGGITGGFAGRMGGTVRIRRCYSTGPIGGNGAGGICGRSAGLEHGETYIYQSYSTGEILRSAKFGGGIVGIFAAYGDGYLNVENCLSTGNISAENSGGIVGGNSAVTRGTVRIVDSFSRGDISGADAGGICGNHGGYGEGVVYIKNCSSAGDILVDAVDSGGIIGEDAGENGGNIHIQDCSTTGKISAARAGGITGHSAGHNNGEVHIANCSSRGDIEGAWVGGICGSNAGSSGGKVYISGSYSNGNVHTNAGYAGGIVGVDAGVSGGLVRIQECYSTGQILAKSSGGITGSIAADNNGEVHIVNCHSRGDIGGKNSGGICGRAAGYRNGQVYVTNCFSSGNIMWSAQHGGGILGSAAGFKGGYVYVDKCYSTGKIYGPATGGICGRNAAVSGGQVHILRSYSTGNILTEGSGGIVSGNAGWDGNVQVKECFSTGDILADGSGGITGMDTAENGEVNIVNCYSRGQISGDLAGGITGKHTGGASGFATGIVSIDKSYASGTLVHPNAGGIVGSILNTFSGDITLEYSVYNENRSIGSDPANNLNGDTTEGLSSNLEDIRGQLYKNWNDGKWTINGTNELPILCFQLPCPSPTPSPTVTPTSSITPSTSRTATTSPSPTASSSNTPSPTGSGTPTSSFTASPSKTATSSASPTASPSTSATPSGSGTPTSTPSRIALHQTSQDISSGCGQSDPFNCGTAVFESSPSLDNTFWNSSSQSMNVSVQSVQGIEPTVLTSCSSWSSGKIGQQIDNLYFGCEKAFQQTGLTSQFPVDLLLSLIKNSTCQGRKSDVSTCRQYEYSGYISFRENFEESIRRHLAIKTQQSSIRRQLGSHNVDDIFLPFAAVVVLGNDTLLSTEQNVTMRVNEDLLPDGDPENQYALSVRPRRIFLPIDRTKGTDSQLVVPLTFTSASGIRVQWEVSQNATSFIRVPSDEVFEETSGVITVHRNVSIKQRLLPPGSATLHMHVNFLNIDNDLLKRVPLRAVVDVRQAVARVEPLSVRESRSVSHSGSQRTLRLQNVGSLDMQWNLNFLSNNGSIVPQSNEPWLDVFPASGTIAPFSSRAISLRFAHRNSSQRGQSTVWMYVKTNAWNADSPAFDETISRETPQKLSESKPGNVRFWVFVEYIVSSVFTCKGFNDNISLHPLESKRLLLSIANTEREPIRILLEKLTVRRIDDSLLIDSWDNTSVNHQELSLTKKQRRNNVFHCGNWMRIFPQMFKLREGTVSNTHIDLGYPDPYLMVPVNSSVYRLAPGIFETELHLRVLLVSSGVSYFERSTVSFSHAAGLAAGMHSVVRLQKDSGIIGDVIQGTITLADRFGNRPAKAVVGAQSTRGSSAHHGERVSGAPRVSVASDQKRVFEIRIQSKGSVSGTIPFELLLKHQGNGSVNVRIGEAPVMNSPASISVSPKSCPVSEVNVGGKCKCLQGHRRAQTGECVQCKPGNFQPEPTNLSSCFPCPNGYFAEAGSSSCTACPYTGVECRKGMLEMASGYWCDICVEKSSPRADLLSRIYGGSELKSLFHKCSPPEACQVNGTAFSTVCSEGYRGPVCGQCAEGYAKAGGNACAPCRSAGENIVLNVSFALIAFAIMAGFVYRASKETAADAQAHNDGSDLSSKELRPSNGNQQDLGDTIPNTIEEKRELNDLDKIFSRLTLYNIKSFKHAILIFIDYLQIGNILHSTEISPFKGLAAWISEATSASTMNPAHGTPFRCLTGFDSVQVAWITMATPLIVVALVCMVALFIEIGGQRSISMRQWLRTSTWASILVLNLLYMSVSMMTIRSFQRHSKAINGSERSALDVELKTSSSKFILLQGVAAASFIVFVFSYPAIQAGYYFRRYTRLQNPSEAFQFWKLTGGYRLRSLGFLWEITVLVRKLLLILVAIWYPRGTGQFVLTGAVLWLSYMQAIYQRPYIERPVSSLQFLLIFVSVANAGMGLIRQEVSQAISVQGGAHSFSITSIDETVIAIQILFAAATLLVVVYLSPGAMRALDELVLARIRRVLSRVRSYFNRWKRRCKQRKQKLCRVIAEKKRKKSFQNYFSRICDKCSCCTCKRRGTKRDRLSNTRFHVGEQIPEPTGGINPLQAANVASSGDISTAALQKAESKNAKVLPELPGKRFSRPSSSNRNLLRSIVTEDAAQSEGPVSDRKRFTPTPSQRRKRGLF